MSDRERVYPEELMRKGGTWLGALRNRIKWLRCGGGNESIIWGSDVSPTPPFTMREVEELGAEAAAAAMNECIAERDATRRQNDELATKLAETRAEVEALKTDAVAEFRCPDCGAVMTTHVGTGLKAEVERMKITYGETMSKMVDCRKV